MKGKIRKILMTIMLISLAFIVTSCGKNTNENKVIKLNLSINYNESSNYYKGAMKIAEEVREATNGKIEINTFAGGSLGGEREVIEFALSGDLDIGSAANSVLTNFIPEMSILDQAFLWENAEQAHAAVDGKIGKLIDEKAKELGVHVIGYMESGFRNVFSKRKIEKIEDFKGLKIRTMQNEYHMTAFESFGAMPTSMAGSEQFTALQQGTIDAVENAVSNCLSNGFYELTKDITYTNHAFVYIVLCMSDKAWNQIPEELREPFLQAVKRGCAAQRKYLVEANEEAEKILAQKYGVKFHKIDNKMLKETYLKISKQKGYIFDPVWQAAVDEAIASTNNN